MKKFRYILLFFSCFLACISGGKALNGCASEVVEEFNKVGSKSNITGYAVCKYSEYNRTNDDRSCHIEVYEDYTLDKINPHYYVYQICSYKNSGKTTAKMMLCSHKYGDLKYEVHTPLYSFVNSADPEPKEVGYYDTSVGDALIDPTLDDLYSYGDGSYLGTLQKFFSGNDGAKKQCPMYMGIRETIEYDGWENLQVSANSNVDEKKYYYSSGDLVVHMGVCTETGTQYDAVGIDIVTDKKVTYETTKIDDPDQPIDANTDYEDTLRSYEANLCKTDGVLKVLRALHTILTIARIVIPLIIIIVGSVNFAKASLDGAEDVLKKNSQIFIKQLFIGILVFFIPTIVSIFVSFIDDAFIGGGSLDNCISCFNGDKADCDKKIEFYEMYRYKMIPAASRTDEENRLLDEYKKNNPQDYKLLELYIEDNN